MNVEEICEYVEEIERQEMEELAEFVAEAVVDFISR